jgi:hypothetical protein
MFLKVFLKVIVMVLVFSLCLTGQAQAGAISIKNRNCVYQGLSKTNQTKFHIRPSPQLVTTIPQNVPLANQCSDQWITLKAGSTQKILVETFMRSIGDLAMDCDYTVEAEGTFTSPWVSGSKISSYLCEADVLGVCQCRKK